MGTFNVYKHPTKSFEAVKVGFCWPAFFFGIFWMVVAELCGYACLWLFLLIVSAFIDFVYVTVTEASGILTPILFIEIILVLITGYKGNAWRGESLFKRDYEFLSSFEAYTKKEAIAKQVENSGN